MNKKYEKEVKEKWGETKEYKEFQERENKILSDEVIGQLGIVLSSFSQSLNNNVSPKSPEVQQLVEELKAFINNFYECNNVILLSLSLMYATDERFTNFIDGYGEGTAEYIQQAIETYCENNK